MTPLVAVSRCPAAAGVITSHHHPPGAQLLPCIIDSVDPVLIILWTRQYASAEER